MDATLGERIAEMAESTGIGELAKPVTKLIEAIQSATGVLYEPRRIRNEAQAQAEAAIIKAEADAKCLEIVDRAKARLFIREMKRQKTIEDVTAKATDELPDQVSDTPVNPDWTTTFFESCQDVSDDDMQRLWAKLLAGEIARPGSYSLKTLNVLKSLTKSDAELFTRLCSFNWHMNGSETPIVHSDGDPIAQSFPTLDEREYLTSLGLTTILGLGSYQINFNSQTIDFKATYFGQRFLLVLPPGKKSFETGTIRLTRMGQQIAKIVPAVRDDLYLQKTLLKWKTSGFQIHDGSNMPQQPPAGPPPGCGSFVM
jgi:hypothetical protein